MKKLLLVLTIAGFAVACNNDGDKKETTDSTTISTDTTKMSTDTTIITTDTTTKKDTTKM